MRIERYVDRILSILYSRRDIEIEEIEVDVNVETEYGFISARLVYWDGSLLEFDEMLSLEGEIIVKKRYNYHYQTGGEIIFRYDNAPHRPEIPTFPHHKHTATGGIIPAIEPHLREVLREIDSILEMRSSSANNA